MKTGELGSDSQVLCKELCPCIHQPASTFSSPPPGSRASRNKKPKGMGLNGLLLCCSQTTRKSRPQDMPREAPTLQARCRSCIFFAGWAVPPSNSLFQEYQVPSDWHSTEFGQGQNLGSAVPSGKCLQLPGILCSLWLQWRCPLCTLATYSLVHIGSHEPFEKQYAVYL